MKTVIKNMLAKCLLLFVLIMVQAQAWAFTGNESNDMGKWQMVAHMPAFWAGVAVLIGCIVGASFIGREKKPQQLQ